MSLVKYTSPEQKPMIFISYAHEDAENVTEFAKCFTDQGFSIWIDHKRIEPGSPFNPDIDLNLNACELFLVFLSRYYVQKDYCKIEFNNAIDHQKVIIPVCLDDVSQELNPEASYMFNRISGFNRVNYKIGVRNDADFESVCEQLCSSSVFQWTLLPDAERESKRMMLSTTAALIDRLEYHRKTVYRTSGNYYLDKIHAELFPGLKDEGSKVIYYDENRQETPLYSCIQSHPHQNYLMVGEGGMGKTVAMMGLFAHLRSLQIPAIYIPLRSIDFSRDSLTTYIQRVVCGYNAGYWNEIKMHYQTLYEDRPNLVLLLDGINEVPLSQVKRMINGELLGELLQSWRGCQIVMSSRYDFRSQYNDLEQHFQVLFMQELEIPQIKRYLEKCGLPNVTGSDMMKLLSNPLLLSLYANAEVCRDRYNQIPGVELEKKPDNPGKIIGNFLKTQLYRAFQGAYTNLPEHLLVLEYILPAVAHHMVRTQRMNISEDDLDDLMYDLKDNVRLSWFKRDRLNRIMREIGPEELPPWDDSRLYNLAVRGLHFLQKTDLDSTQTDQQSPLVSYEFLHQNFRDYFAAYHVTNEITAIAARPKRLRESEAIIREVRYPKEILNFVSNITREEAAMPLLTGEGWQFPGKTGPNQPSDFSPSEQVLSLYRGQESEEARNAVYNLVEIMRVGRNQLLAWCDFSELDLRNCHMNKTKFVLWHREQLCPSCFDGAWMDRTFLLNQGHESAVSAICTDGANLIFSGDRDGMVRTYDFSENKWKESIPGQNDPVIDLCWNGANRILAILYANAAYTYAPGTGEIHQHCVNEYRSKKYRYVRFASDGGLEIAYDMEPLIYYTMDGQRIAPKMDFDVVVHCAQWHPTRLEYIRSYMFHMISSNYYNEKAHSWWQHAALLEKRDQMNLERKEKNLPRLTKVYLRLSDDGVPQGDSVNCLCYHPSGNRFLVAIHNLVLEYDNNTMTLIRKKELPAKAHTLCYGKEDAVYVGCGSSIVVLGRDFSLRLTLPGVPTAAITIMNPDPKGDCIYLMTNHSEIKKLDSELRVQRIRTFTGGTKVFNWCCDRSTGEYQMMFLPGRQYPNGSRYDFETNEAKPLGWCYEQLELWPNHNTDDHRVYNMIDYLLKVNKNPPYSRTTFVNYRGIWIFGCSFLNLKGDMTEKKNQQLLKQNGGITNA